MMDIEMKKTAPPFENLMSYEAMRSIKVQKPNEDIKGMARPMDAVLTRNVGSCYDNMKSHSGLISNIFDVAKDQGNSSNMDGCYSARKIIIDRVESLTSFLNEGGSDNGDSCTSTDSDSLGDEGYSTDNHTTCPSTNLSSSSSSLVSSDGELTSIITKPGILKRSTDRKNVMCRKKVTFTSLPIKVPCLKDISPSQEKTLEQKIMALSIINEENESENRVLRNESTQSKGCTVMNQMDSALHHNSVLPHEQLCRGTVCQDYPLSINKCHLQENIKNVNHYENIPETRHECMTYLRQSQLPQNYDRGVPPGIVNQRMSRNSVACPYLHDMKSRSFADGVLKQTIPTSHVKHCVTRTVSNNLLHGCTFARSSDILRLFQSSDRTNHIAQTIGCQRNTGDVLSNVHSMSSEFGNSKVCSQPQHCVSNPSDFSSDIITSTRSLESRSFQVHTKTDISNKHEKSNYHCSSHSNQEFGEIVTSRPLSCDSKICKSSGELLPLQYGMTKSPLSRQSSLPISCHGHKQPYSVLRDKRLLTATRVNSRLSTLV